MFGMGQLHKNVLSVSPDQELARSRGTALTEIGFTVVSVRNGIEARYEISLGRCGILLLCHKLPRHTRDELAAHFQRSCPEPFVVAVLADDREIRPTHADICVVHSNDHAMLLDALIKKIA